MANRLELTWVGKENRPRVEPRVLLEESAKSFHAPKKVSENDLFDNRLIFGDNLLGLKALEQEFAGKVRCVFIDPPYNTGSAFEHYEDGLEHSIWLSMMRDRLEIIRRLMSDDGSLWITIDDNEAHYLKVLCDEVFGRANFVANVVWEKVYTPKSNGRGLSADHDHILVFAKTPEWLDYGWNLIPRSNEQENRFKNPDGDPNGPWRTYPLDVRTENGARREKYRYEVRLPSGRGVRPAPGRHWALPQARFDEERAGGNIYFGKDGDALPTKKVYLKDAQEGVIARTWWPYREVTGNQDAKHEVLQLFGDSGFITPKPEKLIERILLIATRPGDWVLDSFAGSGTTGAVAHKMGRRWIMVELGEHCHTHIIPRLKKIIEGKDDGGITQAIGWKGGGGFRYFGLAPSLLARDEYGNWVVNKQYNAAMLAEAVCKLEGYRYAPSPEVYWQHGHSTDDSFIYVTTQTLLVEQLRRLNEEVGPRRSLLICCGSFTAKNLTDFPRLTVKKIPKAVLHRCEWGHDDYSLEIRNLPAAPTPLPLSAPATEGKTKESRRRTVTLLSYGET
jgi:adenine-specific DNA-methyltransferase